MRRTCLIWLTPILLGQSPPEPGASPGVELVDISKNSAQFASAFPFVAVSPKDDNTVAVAWRLYSLPIDTNAPKNNRTADCNVSISKDASATFRDTNLMSFLRTERSDTMPELWFCNAPWAVFGLDGAIYAGGALFTANGVVAPEPKQGRQMVAVSHDLGATWSKGIPGLTVDKFAPGVVGIEGGKFPQDTPWDGAKGVVDAVTGTFYSTAQGYIAASVDKGSTFGTVYRPASSKDGPGVPPTSLPLTAILPPCISQTARQAQASSAHAWCSRSAKTAADTSHTT